MSDRLRVMVVDDHTVVRAGLLRVLERDQGIMVVGCLRTGEEALAALEMAAPDVVVLDHNLPGASGAEVCTEILRRQPKGSVLILTATPTEEVVRSGLAAGAAGVLSKATAVTGLPAAVKAVSRGEAVLCPDATRLVTHWARRASTGAPGARLLTPIEIEILRLASEGFTNNEAGARLKISIEAVRHHLSSAMRKLGVTRRLAAVAAGVERGVI